MNSNGIPKVVELLKHGAGVRAVATSTKNKYMHGMLDIITQITA